LHCIAAHQTQIQELNACRQLTHLLLLVVFIVAVVVAAAESTPDACCHHVSQIRLMTSNDEKCYWQHSLYHSLLFSKILTAKKSKKMKVKKMQLSSSYGLLFINHKECTRDVGNGSEIQQHLRIPCANAGTQSK
jgi:hypothetical protein